MALQEDLLLGAHNGSFVGIHLSSHTYRFYQ
jgi:hypothetical protein